MILTCPSCGTQFSLPDEALGDKGRKVKCTSCAEVWFQEPERDAEEIFEELVKDIDVEEALEDFVPGERPDDDFEQEHDESSDDLPDVDEDIIPARPAASDSDDDMPSFMAGESVDQSDMDSDAQSKGNVFIGFIAVLVISLVIGLVGLFAMKSQLTQAWPSSKVIYALFGQDIEIPGQGLVFDRISVQSAESDSGTVFQLEGSIINLTTEDRIVPIILVSIRDEEAQEIASWLIEPPENILNAEGVMEFSASHEIDSKAEAFDASVSFKLDASH